MSAPKDTDIDEEFERQAREGNRWREEAVQERAKQARAKSAPPVNDVDGQINIHNWPIMASPANYGVIGKITELATRNSEADPVAVIVMSLARAAAEFGRSTYMRIGDAVHPPRIFATAVGLSGLARKGTAQTAVDRIFERAQEIRTSILREERLRADGPPRAALPADGPLEVVGGPLSSAEGIIHTIRDPSEEKDDHGVPKDPGVDDKRLLIQEEELTSVFEVTRRSGNLVSPLLRKAYDGKTLRPLTKNNRLCATRPHINIIGHITLHELREMLKVCGGEVWNGFANRFLWMLVRRQKIIALPPPMPDTEVDEIAQDLAGAILFVHENGQEVRLSNEAAVHWSILYSELTQEEPGVVGALLSRLPTHALRVALTYALFDRASFISVKHLEAAMAVCRYAHDSVVYLFGDPKPNPDIDTILEGLKKASGRLTKSGISALFGRNKKAAEITSILTEMQERSMVTIEQEEGSKKTWVVLNPNVQKGKGK